MLAAFFSVLGIRLRPFTPCPGERPHLDEPDVFCMGCTIYIFSVQGALFVSMMPTRFVHWHGLVHIPLSCCLC